MLTIKGVPYRLQIESDLETRLARILNTSLVRPEAMPAMNPLIFAPALGAASGSDIFDAASDRCR